MTTPSPAGRLAVCSWSLQPAEHDDLVRKLVATGIARVQLALSPLVSDEAWAGAGDVLAEAGITVVSGMFGTEGEDYTTLETIKATGGVVPDATWDANRAHIEKVVPAASGLGVDLVSFHAGFLPESPDDPDYAKLMERLRWIAGIFARADIDLAFETGQEDAATLRRFLDDLAAPNVGVNFDPANMILYGKGDPVVAVRELARFVRQVHIKDADPATSPGEWGTEVVVGTGSVNWREFLAALDEGGFRGDMCIEREAGESRFKDIAAARSFILKALS